MLAADRDRSMAKSEEDKAWIAENLEKLKDDEDKQAEEQLKELEESSPPEDDEHKQLIKDGFRIKWLMNMYIVEDEWIERIHQFRKIKVFKMGRFMQAIFFLLGYDKKGIVEDGTMKFQWKTAKDQIDEKFLTKMRDYQIMGQKKEEYKAYQTINYVEKLLEEITMEQVSEFDFIAGRLYYWLDIALKSRK